VWDPATYLRYGDERGRPFGDLLGRVRAPSPAEVVDLGCGPGTLTVGLTDRFPGARIRGLDSSAEMISSARALGSTVEFDVLDVRDWQPDPAVGVVLANAVLQWVPGHTDLLRRWAGALTPGAHLAFQVPGNFEAPSHRAIRAVASGPRWSARVAEGLRDPASVLEPVAYAELLTAAGCTVDAWETTYVHQLPVTGAEHPVLGWLEGTALRPVRATLDDPDWTAFRAELEPALAGAYPVRDGSVFFSFRRIFVVART
jgi:trans-aconitate 2-methyltransferase